MCAAGRRGQPTAALLLPRESKIVYNALGDVRLWTMRGLPLAP